MPELQSGVNLCGTDIDHVTAIEALGQHMEIYARQILPQFHSRDRAAAERRSRHR